MDFSAAAVAVVKPCEASALDALVREGIVPRPVVLSFFCAGVPSQNATTELVRQVGCDPESVTSLRYRGNGWPGDFAVTTEDGGRGSRSYEQSWGEVLGRTTQLRCKLCPDGVGESADIAVGDFWDSDERGYPIFEEQDGTSVVIARTGCGDQMVKDAIAAGAIVGVRIDLQRVVPVQPLQVARRSTLAARLLGMRIAGRTVPKYSGFPLVRLAIRAPITSLRAAFGAFRRGVRRRDDL